MAWDQKAYLAEYDKRPERLAKKRERHMKNRDVANYIRRNNAYKKLYGITIDEYEQMLINQNGVCAICSSTTGERNLCVDHDHSTGKVRALLCHSCNVGISYLESPMHAAYQNYLERYK